MRGEPAERALLPHEARGHERGGEFATGDRQFAGAGDAEAFLLPVIGDRERLELERAAGHRQAAGLDGGDERLHGARLQADCAADAQQLVGLVFARRLPRLPQKERRPARERERVGVGVVAGLHRVELHDGLADLDLAPDAARQAAERAVLPAQVHRRERQLPALDGEVDIPLDPEGSFVIGEPELVERECRTADHHAAGHLAVDRDPGRRENDARRGQRHGERARAHLQRSLAGELEIVGLRLVAEGEVVERERRPLDLVHAADPRREARDLALGHLEHHVVEPEEAAARAGTEAQQLALAGQPQRVGGPVVRGGQRAQLQILPADLQRAGEPGLERLDALVGDHEPAAGQRDADPLAGDVELGGAGEPEGGGGAGDGIGGDVAHGELVEVQFRAEDRDRARELRVDLRQLLALHHEAPRAGELELQRLPLEDGTAAGGLEALLVGLAGEELELVDVELEARRQETDLRVAARREEPEIGSEVGPEALVGIEAKLDACLHRKVSREDLRFQVVDARDRHGGGGRLRDVERRVFILGAADGDRDGRPELLGHLDFEPARFVGEPRDGDARCARDHDLRQRETLLALVDLAIGVGIDADASLDERIDRRDDERRGDGDGIGSAHEAHRCRAAVGRSAVGRQLEAQRIARGGDVVEVILATGRRIGVPLASVERAVSVGVEVGPHAGERLLGAGSVSEEHLAGDLGRRCEGDEVAVHRRVELVVDRHEHVARRGGERVLPPGESRAVREERERQTGRRGLAIRAVHGRHGDGHAATERGHGPVARTLERVAPLVGLRVEDRADRVGQRREPHIAVREHGRGCCGHGAEANGLLGVEEFEVVAAADGVGQGSRLAGGRGQVDRADFERHARAGADLRDAAIEPERLHLLAGHGGRAAVGGAHGDFARTALLVGGGAEPLDPAAADRAGGVEVEHLHAHGGRPDEFVVGRVAHDLLLGESGHLDHARIGNANGRAVHIARDRRAGGLDQPPIGERLALVDHLQRHHALVAGVGRDVRREAKERLIGERVDLAVHGHVAGGAAEADRGLRHRRRGHERRQDACAADLLGFVPIGLREIGLAVHKHHAGEVIVGLGGDRLDDRGVGGEEGVFLELHLHLAGELRKTEPGERAG